MAIALYRVGYDTDVRDVLPSINVPTLVMHTSRRRFRRGAEYLAERIPRARLVPLESRETFIWLGDTRQLVDEVEEFLTGTRSEAESDRVLATVLFSDIVSSTRRTTEIGDRRWREIIERHDSMARRHVDRFRGRYVKATGDGILATFDGPARAINCARDMRDTITRSLGIELRFGLHTGEIEPREDDITGIAVHIGQRVSALAGAGEILVSRTVTDLVAGSGLEFEDRGDHELKGVLGRWRLFAVKS
jgi:class 3 adenylate cyclase